MRKISTQGKGTFVKHLKVKLTQNERNTMPGYETFKKSSEISITKA